MKRTTKIEADKRARKKSRGEADAPAVPEIEEEEPAPPPPPPPPPQPDPPVAVRGESTYAEHAMVQWDLSGTTPSLVGYSIGAIDVSTNERLEDLAREEYEDAVGSLIDDPRLTASRVLRFFVVPLIVSPTSNELVLSERSSELSKPVTIGKKDFSAVRLNSPAVLRRDSAALDALIKHGSWSSAQHIGAMRSLFVNSLGLVRLPRPGRPVQMMRSTSYHTALSGSVNCGNVMRSVLLRYATRHTAI